MNTLTAEYQEYLTRKLKHYNTWLGDLDSREMGTPYPGFPEDFPVKKSKKTVVKAVATAPKSVTKRVVRIAGESKKVRAIKIVQSMTGQAKTAIIESLMSELAMSKAGATTYYYNSVKELGAA